MTVAILLATLARSGGAQEQYAAAERPRGPRLLVETAGTRVPADVNRTPMLRRRVSLDFAGVPFKDAVAELARQAGISIVLSDDVAPVESRVEIHARGLTLAAALTELLIDTNLDVVFRQDGTAALVPRPPAPPAPRFGAVTGRVSDARTGAPVAATLQVEGMRTGATAGDDGSYRLAQVPVGTHTLVVRRIGYAPARRSVTVAADRDADVSVMLQAAAATLEQVVTTATGEQRRIELGNAVATIDVAARRETAPVKNMGDLLTAVVPGVQVTNANMTGAVSRVRIRGQSSITLSNDPIYIIDGVRMTSTAGGAGTGGGTVPTRVNDIDPEEVESIEVVKGPSAGTLYGTDAANGIIVITTRRGKAGKPTWSVHAEHGRIEDRNDYLPQYALLGHAPGAMTPRRCYTTDIAVGACVVDSATVLDLWKDPYLTPLKPSPRSSLGAQLSGGSELLRYFLSADGQQEDGPFGLPAFDERRFDSLGVTIRPEMRRPNHLEQLSVRSNFTATLGPALDLALSVGATSVAQRFPQSDNNTSGFVYNAVTGPGYASGPGYSGVGALGEKLYGYALMTPGESFQRLSEQRARRLISSATASWRPLAWLESRADVGLDLTDREDILLQRAGEGPTGGTDRQGIASDGRTGITNLTSNLTATATWQPRAWLQLRSTTGVQYVAFDLNSTTVQGTQLAPGGEAPSQGAVYSVTTSSSPSRTLGLFQEEQAAINDRLFLTAAVRTDQNSAFGTNFQHVYYPKGSLSWIVSDERFFPRLPLLDQLRLRASYGASGVQPGSTAALRTYAASSVTFQGTTAVGLTQSSPGNSNLRPERSMELETGIDTRWLGGRASVELTYYNKHTRDALITQQVAPSAGVGGYLANIGGVRNAGVELRVTGQLVDTRSLGVDVALSGSHNANRVTALGTFVSTAASTSSIRVGYPVNSSFQRTITWNDANHDGLLAPSEVTIGAPGDTRWVGQNLPPTEMSLNVGVDLLDRSLRISALADRKAGGRYQNLERMLPCLIGTSCPDLQRMDASLAEQARAIAARQGVYGGYNENSDYTRIREISATYHVADRLARRWLGASGATVSLAVRNVKLWKDAWTGTDPEAFIASNADVPLAVLTVAPPTYFMARVNLKY